MFKKIFVQFIILVLALSVALPVFAANDVLGYNHNNLSIIMLQRNGVTTYTVRDGGHWIVNFPSFTDAVAALNYMKNYNTIAFSGRGTASIQTWFENTAVNPIVAPSTHSNDDLSYNPNNLSIIFLQNQGKTTYTVRDGNHWIVNFPTFKDAEQAMNYMRHFNTVVFTGRGTPNINTWFEMR